MLFLLLLLLLLLILLMLLLLLLPFCSYSCCSSFCYSWCYSCCYQCTQWTHAYLQHCWWLWCWKLGIILLIWRLIIGWMNEQFEILFVSTFRHRPFLVLSNTLCTPGLQISAFLPPSVVQSRSSVEIISTVQENISPHWKLWILLHVKIMSKAT